MSDLARGRLTIPAHYTATRAEGDGALGAQGPQGAYRSLMELALLATQTADALAERVDAAAGIVARSVLAEGLVLACGNGGSAADAQHFVAELVGHLSLHRRALPAVALSSDPSIVTAIGNDYGFEHLFARQVEAYGSADDVLVAITTSGRSPNVLRALEAAQRRGMRTVALTGAGGDSAVLDACDVRVAIPSSDTQRVQELHTAVLHAIAERVDAAVLGSPYSDTNV